MIRLLLFFAVTTMLLCGCFSPPADQTRFYILTPAKPAPTTTAVERDKVFLIGLRVTSAEYLRSKQMIVELGPNQLRLSAADQWEELPQAGFTRILTERIAQTLPDCQLVPLPLALTNQPEFILEIELISLQGRLQPRREAEVSAELRILDGSSRLLERAELRQESPWIPASGSDGYGELAAAESRAAAELADAIGAKILACHRQYSGR
jgi:uncharacterized lipoprotein YmbA